MIAVGTRPAGGGQIALAEPPRPGRADAALDVAGRTRSRASSASWPASGREPNLAIVDADGDGEGGRPGGRHIAARTSVMNLVVVARQPEVGERSAETISRLTGRHPSRTLIIQGADPDGPPWIDARIQAHCVMPRPDAPETCTELIFLTAGGETGRHLFGARRAAADPRPAGHGLVARRAAAPVGARARPARGDGPPRRRRVDLVGRRRRSPGPAGRPVRRLRPAVDPRLRARAAVALARGDRDRLRPPRLPAVPAQRPPDLGDLRDPRRDRRARDDQHRQAAVPRRVAGLAAGHAGRDAARRRRAEDGTTGRRRASRPGEKLPLHSGLAGPAQGPGNAR